MRETQTEAKLAHVWRSAPCLYRLQHRTFTSEQRLTALVSRRLFDQPLTSQGESNCAHKESVFDLAFMSTIAWSQECAMNMWTQHEAKREFSYQWTASVYKGISLNQDVFIKVRSASYWSTGAHSGRQNNTNVHDKKRETTKRFAHTVQHKQWLGNPKRE